MKRAVYVLPLLAWNSLALASPVQWTLSDVLFEDQGTASGSFVYDADTDAYSSIAITVTDGSLQPLTTYNGLLLGGSTDAAFVPDAGLADLAGAPVLQLVFQSALTSAGGTVSLVDAFLPAASSFDGHCADAGCVQFDFGRLMVDGIVTGAPVSEVPLPGALVLFGPAMLGTAWFRRRGSRAHPGS